jgi:hypothetical protein
MLPPANDPIGICAKLQETHQKAYKILPTAVHCHAIPPTSVTNDSTAINAVMDSPLHGNSEGHITFLILMVICRELSGEMHQFAVELCVR